MSIALMSFLRVHPLIVSLLVLFFFTREASATEINVTEWALNVRASQTGVGQDIRVFNTPQSPFQDSHTATILNSSSTTVYDNYWNAMGFARFLATANQAAAGGSNVRSSTFGAISLMVSVDTRATFSSSYTYQLGGGSRQGFIEMSVYDVALDERVFNVFDFAIPPFSPLSGTMEIPETEFVLLSHRAYVLIYSMELDSFGGAQADLSLGSGHALIELAPVPEPSTALLLGFACLPLAGRRRCQAMRLDFYTTLHSKQQIVS